MPPRTPPPAGGWGAQGASLDGLREAIERRRAATIALYRAAAGDAESRMRSGARWTDRTALARASLHAEPVVERRGDELEISLVLAHGVGYGRWLETTGGPLMGRRGQASLRDLSARRNQGPLAILWPTAEALAPELRDAVRRIWSPRGPAV